MKYFDANTIGVKNLLDASKHLLNLNRIVFTSSLLVCKNGYIPKSDIEYCPPNLYGESKVIGEKLIRESKIPCDWVIVRPTSIWGPWFEHSYKKFFQVLYRGLYLQPGLEPIIKPLGYVGNTVYMMNKILFDEVNSTNHNTYYLGDYPQHTIQEWADLIRCEFGKNGKNPVFPIFGLRLIAKIGDTFKFLGWSDPPLTTFRLNNMLTGAHYPIDKTQEIVGKLPYNLTTGIQKTIDWMRMEVVIK